MFDQFSNRLILSLLWRGYTTLLCNNLSCYELQCIDSMQHFRSKIVIFAKMLSNALEIKISVIFVNNKRRGGGVFSLNNICCAEVLWISHAMHIWADTRTDEQGFPILKFGTHLGICCAVAEAETCCSDNSLRVTCPLLRGQAFVEGSVSSGAFQRTSTLLGKWQKASFRYSLDSPLRCFSGAALLLNKPRAKATTTKLRKNKKRAHFNTKVDEDDDDDDDVIRIIYYCITEKITPFSLAASMPIYDHLSCTALQINARTFVKFPVI